MKALLFLLMPCLAGGMVLHAQEAQPKKAPRVETVHEHTGASHQHTHTAAPMEHRSTSSWHYHSGQKRPQVPLTEQGSAKDSLKK